MVNGARALIDAVNAAAAAAARGVADIPPPRADSRAHNLQRERTFVPLRVKDPVDQTERRCEHFAEYGSAAHALSYFRGNENIPAVCDPILAALLKEEAVTSLGENLHWKLTLNDYKASTEDALAEAGGALFPWHTDLAANGEITAISTLLAPAIMEFAPHADAPGAPTRIVAKPGRSCCSRVTRVGGPPRDAPPGRRGQGADFSLGCARRRRSSPSRLRPFPSYPWPLSNFLFSPHPRIKSPT